MKLILGYSTGVFWTTVPEMRTRVSHILQIQNQAIELHITSEEDLDSLLNSIDEELIHNLRKFKYKFIHTPVLKVRYPCSNKITNQLFDLAEKIECHTLVFHPDIVDDFSWVGKTFGSLSAFENMDVNKSFGKTVTEMEEVFNKSPESKFVFDANHLFTLDKDMKDTESFHERFGNRLSHYHLSGCAEEGHVFLHETKEVEILSGIKNYSVPIIHEGVLKTTENLNSFLKNEQDYVMNAFLRA